MRLARESWRGSAGAAKLQAVDPHPADNTAPFVWLCRRCRVHADEDLASREAATQSAEQHAARCHPGKPPRYVITQQFARCQWRRRFFSRICGAPASWAHAPATQIHLCATHQVVVTVASHPKPARPE